MATDTKIKYVPMIPQQEIDRKFHYYKDDGSLGIKADCKLIRNIEELKKVAKEFEGVKIAVDTETTGLSYISDVIVGFSISKDSYSGIYVPIRHQIKRVDEKKISKTDEEGNILYTKAGKPKQKTVKEETFFECPSNLPAKEALDVLYDIMVKSKAVFMHNSTFDLNMIKKEGYNVMKVPSFDTMILPYVYDPEGRGIMGLKKIVKILGRIVPEFKDVLGKESNFRYVDPELGYEYACYDSMNTFRVFEFIFPMVKNLLNKSPYKMILDGKEYNIVDRDNKLIKAFVDYYGHAELKIDKQIAITYKEQIIEDLKKVMSDIYAYFDIGQFNLSTSSKEFKETMASRHITTGLKTDKGAVSFSKDGLKEFNKNLRAFRVILDKFEVIQFENSKINKRDGNKTGNSLIKILKNYGEPYFEMEETANTLKIRDLNGAKLDKSMFKYVLESMYEQEKEKMNVLVNVQKNNSLNKAMNAYVDKLTKVDSCKMNYKLLATSSCRLASGNGARSDKNKNDYYIDLNAQNLTKPKSCFYEAVKSNEDGNILGWKFTEVTDDYAYKHSSDKIIVEGSAQKGNIRSCIVAPEGRYIMSRDYSSQEYLALAILSNDSKMIDNFKKGLDPHTSTAYAIWGEENYTKDKRKKAKTCLGDNSFIKTSRGLIRPYDLRHTHAIIDRYGNSQQFKMEKSEGDLIEVLYSTGIKEEYTPEHKVYTWTGDSFAWKQVKDLTEDDEVVQLCNIHDVYYKKDNYIEAETVNNRWKKYKVNIDSDSFSYLAGLYVGKGTARINKYNNINRIKLIAPKECLSRIEKSLSKMKVDITKYLTVRESSSKNNAYIITYPPIASILSSMFGASDKYVPDYVYSNWSKVAISNFMAGYVDSKTHCSSLKYVRSSCSENLMSSICLLSSLIGIRTKVTKSNDTFKDGYYHIIFYISGATSSFKSEVYKNKKTSVMKQSGKWTVTKDYINKIYQENKDYKNASLMLALNEHIKLGFITNKLIKDMRKANIDFPIQDNMQCAKVIRKTNTKGNIYIIETDNHEYISSCIVSHNCNFLMNYGGGKYRLADSLEISIDEAGEIIEGYESAFFECIQWKQKEIQEMYRNGNVVFTEFGRPRQFASWIKTSLNLVEELPVDENNKCIAPIEEQNAKKSKSEQIQKAVERRVASHQIQGLCGDICRYVLLKLYNKYFRNRDPHIDFISTVHDEINFTVDKDRLIDYARECEDIMKFDVLRKDLPITTSLEVGYAYGNCYPFVWEDETRTKLIPKTI